MTSVKEQLEVLKHGIPTNPLPSPIPRDEALPHAPTRKNTLNQTQRKVCLKNSLRYFPESLHSCLASEFLHELNTYGHIYMYRFKPRFAIRAYPLSDFPAVCRQAACIQLMIFNNLDPAVAQFPDELVTYGGNGQVFSNWAQFWIVMEYLSKMTEEQTLVMYSGHPLGLFPSHSNAPRAVITNGMVIPNYSSREQYDNMFALGVTMYGQMTAGSYCYIGPQGIVHGTTISILAAGRKYLGSGNLKGRVFVSSGLGGMSGAQPKAAVITGCIGVIAEVSQAAVSKRFDQGWVKEVFTDLDALVERIRSARENKHTTSIAYLGNIVDLWEKLVEVYEKTGECLVDLGSDQTSCHNPFNGGYYPVQLTFQQANQMMVEKPEKFRTIVEESLRRQILAIDKLCSGGMKFWDYGNAFLLEASRAEVDLGKDDSGLVFKYPSYVQDIMGDVFSLGFGPFRWVCTSGDSKDLEITDRLAAEIIKARMKEPLSESTLAQYEDNLRWIDQAAEHKLVVGSQARILYSDQVGRIKIAAAFNQAVSDGRISSPVVISRDHHDVSGTDSPFRETSNIYDGSAFTADMAVQNCIGDSFRGATWVALHNGGGVGWGEVINGGFGLVLDGSDAAEERAKNMLWWDVGNGVSRRAWSGNSHAMNVLKEMMKNEPRLEVTVAHQASDSVIDELFITS